MDASLRVFDLLGSSCFSILGQYIEKDKIEKYPFELLAPFIRNAEDLANLVLFLQEQGVFKASENHFVLLIDRLNNEKSVIIVYEFLEKQGSPIAAQPIALENFLQIRDSHDLEKVKETLRNILQNKSGLPHALQTDMLKSFFYTKDPLVQKGVDEIAEECRKEILYSDQKDYFMTLYEKRFTSTFGADHLLIETTLPLIVHRGVANRLEFVFKNHGHDQYVINILTDFCRAYLANAPDGEYQKLLLSLNSYA